MKQIIKLTESDLHRIVKESVERILSESDSSIHIKPENKGKFTATKKATGKSTEELTHSKNPLTRKRANFAKMAKRHWKPLKEDYYSMNKPYGGRKFSDFSSEETKGLYDYDPNFAMSYKLDDNNPKYEPALLGNIPYNEPEFPEDEQPYQYWNSLKDFDDRKPIYPSPEDKAYQMDRDWKNNSLDGNWSIYDYADEDGSDDYNYNVHDNAFNAAGAKGRVDRLNSFDDTFKGDKARNFNGTMNSLRK